MCASVVCRGGRVAFLARGAQVDRVTLKGYRMVLKQALSYICQRKWRDIAPPALGFVAQGVW